MTSYMADLLRQSVREADTVEKLKWVLRELIDELDAGE